MEVRTVSDSRPSVGTAALYLAVASLLSAPFVLPMFFSVPYLKALKTVVLVILFSQVVRILASALIAFRENETPPPLPEEDLPTVSVVVPAYNEASVLPGTIEALRNLEYPAEKLQFVLCYEADSTDGTAEIAEAAAAEDDRFVAVRRDEPGGGKAKATNYALGHADGDVIASIDADHQFAPDAVRTAVRWFAADEDVWCVKGRCFGRNPTDSLISLYATVERHVVEKADLYARDLWQGFTVFGGGQAFFRRRVFEEIGRFDEHVMVEDIDMSTRIHIHGKEVRVDPDIITYEENPGSLKAWWSQRKRWARGWFQVSTRYLGGPSVALPSMAKRVDALHTFGYVLLLPVLVLGTPMALVEVSVGHVSAYMPHSEILFGISGALFTLAAALVYLQDYRDGHEHHRREYLCLPTISLYLVINSVVYAAAFLEEFVFDKPSVYVTTSRVGDDQGTDDPQPAD